jgi:hypothetical protein
MKAVFDKTSSLHKPENDSVFEQLGRARAKGKSAEASDSTPANK